MIFIRVFQKLQQYSGAAPLEHWVSRIAVNTCRNALAAEKARPELRHADLSEDEAALLNDRVSAQSDIAPDEQIASRDLVERLLAALKPIERFVIDMLYLQGKSVEEIANVTGWTRTLMKVRAFRARQKLKQQLVRLQTEAGYGRR